MCNCITLVGEKLEAALRGKVPDGAEVSKGFDTGWENQMMSISDGKIHVMLKFKLTYRAKKKSGEMAKNLSRLETSAKMSFCPFCGEDLTQKPA